MSVIYKQLLKYIGPSDCKLAEAKYNLSLSLVLCAMLTISNAYIFIAKLGWGTHDIVANVGHLLSIAFAVVPMAGFVLTKMRSFDDGSLSFVGGIGLSYIIQGLAGVPFAMRTLAFAGAGAVLYLLCLRLYAIQSGSAESGHVDFRSVWLTVFCIGAAACKDLFLYAAPLGLYLNWGLAIVIPLTALAAYLLTNGARQSRFFLASAIAAEFIRQMFNVFMCNITVVMICETGARTRILLPLCIVMVCSLLCVMMKTFCTLLESDTHKTPTETFLSLGKQNKARQGL